MKLIKHSVLLAVLTTSSFASLAGNQAAIASFDAKTLPITERSQVITDKQLALMEEFNRMTEAQTSAIGMFKSGKVQQLQQLGEQTLVEANKFVDEYQTFLSQLPETSTCYVPENVTEYQRMIAEITEANSALSTLASSVGDDEMGATMAMLNVQMHAGRISSLVQMFQMVKMCYMTDAMGLTKADVKRRKAQQNNN
ncbi:hypothetical protein [Shewanella sp. 10N.286.52.B9]|uniref:hypothetical protein n=1 Tax=Shewanella sp. 10N.286.52.B9 TaxID=1880837 RepID=UPI000C840E27|nr:hypothetical protein [Shewanella sp. 10N.286.52.B9]PMG48062.1 hypothetical protein BCU91_02965 [Shewanella sp. 10N.286.52.B9]